MSRLGRTPIELPEDVELSVSGDQVTVKGPKGVLKRSIFAGLSIRVEGRLVYIETASDDVRPASHGLLRALLKNMIVGVKTGFAKTLVFTGVGYRATLQGSYLVLQLGTSHPDGLDIPADLRVVVEKNVEVTVHGVDKQLVGQFAASIRAKKPPEPYKGKGIAYKGEVVRRKAGKAAKGKSS